MYPGEYGVCDVTHVKHPIWVSFSRLYSKMTEKRQTSQSYIIGILEHFVTKLWNITNSVMLFQAVMKFLF